MNSIPSNEPLPSMNETIPFFLCGGRGSIGTCFGGSTPAWQMTRYDTRTYHIISYDSYDDGQQTLVHIGYEQRRLPSPLLNGSVPLTT